MKNMVRDARNFSKSALLESGAIWSCLPWGNDQPILYLVLAIMIRLLAVPSKAVCSLYSRTADAEPTRQRPIS